MPIVQIHLMEGRSAEKKSELVKAVTEAICTTIGSNQSDVRIILSEMSPENYASAGKLKSECRL